MTSGDETSDVGGMNSSVIRGINGLVLLEAVRVATDWLANHRDTINALNVFPVPDGDTGTNMLLTLREAVGAGEKAAETQSGAGDIAGAIARGAFVGARGNSGVILCQMIRGFAASIAGQETIDGQSMAAALAGARDQAYQAVLEPVEGTMLTVVRVAAEAAQAVVDATPDGQPELPDVLAAALRGAQAALATTPELLDILRQANVVDAGGQGVVRILEGLIQFATGVTAASVEQPASPASLGARMDFLDTVVPDHAGDEYGYCVNFVVLADGHLDFAAARAQLSGFGESVEVIGDDHALRVHMHTENPGPILGYAVSLGKLDRIQIDNMELQTQSLMQQRESGREVAPAPETAAAVDPGTVAVLTIAPGAGLADALRSMGAAAVISGGQTMNPSTAELVSGIDAIPAECIIILPNNANIQLTAQQAAGLTDKQVSVVPSRSVPQGLAALAALSPDASLADNVRKMTRALGRVQTIEVTHAMRDAVINGVAVTKDQAIGFVDEQLVASGAELVTVAADTVAAAGLDAAELVTIFTGAGVTAQAAARLRDALLARAPELAVEIHAGGQPHYPFVISVE